MFFARSRHGSPDFTDAPEFVDRDTDEDEVLLGEQDSDAETLGLGLPIATDSAKLLGGLGYPRPMRYGPMGILSMSLVLLALLGATGLDLGV